MPQTPGPWKRVYTIMGHGIAGTGEGDQHIADLYAFDEDETMRDANACLIVAAPDLLAACEAAIEYFNDDALELLVAAVDKARGPLTKGPGTSE